jgi:hypothetical protein
MNRSPRCRFVVVTDEGRCERIAEMDEHFQRMPDDDRLADPASLREHPYWEEARGRGSLGAACRSRE